MNDWELRLSVSLQRLGVYVGLNCVHLIQNIPYKYFGA